MDIDKAVDEIFELAAKERYVYSDSDNSFDAIAGLWFLGDEVEKVLAKIVQYRIISTFLLESLGCLYKILIDKYDIPPMGAVDLTDVDKVACFRGALDGLNSDRAFIRWFTNFLLPNIEGLLRKVRSESLDDISNIGNIADSILRIGKRDKEYLGSELIEDMIFEFANEVMLFVREGDE